MNEEDTQVALPGKKLTDWKNEPAVTDLKQDFTDASSDHETQVSKVNTWLDNLNITGSAKVDTPKGRSKIVPKLIRKQAEWRYASLTEPFLSTEDIYNIAPVSAEDVKSAKQNALVLNNQFNTKLNKVRFFDELIRTVVDEGTGIVRIGWDFEEEDVEVEVPIFEVQPIQDPQQAQMIMQAAQAMQQGGPQAAQQIPPELQEAVKLSLQHGMPVHNVQTGTEIEIQKRTTKNQPTLEVCNYNNVVIDPTCKGDLRKASFVIYSFESSMSELKKDGKYKNLDKINIESNSILGAPDEHDPDMDQSFNFTDTPRKKFIVYEYWGFWDIHGNGIVEPFVASWVGNTMIRMEESPFPDKQVPFVVVQYLPVRRSIYGEPDGELLEDNQKIVGAVTRGMIDILGRSANGQQGYRKDALDVTNRRKFAAGLDYEFNPTVDPQSAFFMHTFPEIPNSAGLMLQMQNSEAESLTGVKAFTGSSGISGQALGENATGIRSALDATSKRELGILRRIAEGVKQIGRKIIAMNAEFLEEGEVIRVTNEEYIEIRMDDMPGNFDLALSISTAEADNDKAQELAFLLQTMGQNQDPEITRMIQVEIATLRKMPALAKQIEEYQAPPPDPIEVEKRQLENELLKAQIAKENSQARENMAEAMLDEARAITEGAKKRKLESDADKTDLDFVEQETGTTQERTLQSQGEQARSNMALKIVEGEMKDRTERRKAQNKPKASA